VQAFFADPVFPPPFLSVSSSKRKYLEQLRISCFLDLELLLEIFHLFLETVEIDLQLLLDPYMISDFCL
jgi:hypothetical protein